MRKLRAYIVSLVFAAGVPLAHAGEAQTDIEPNGAKTAVKVTKKKAVAKKVKKVSVSKVKRVKAKPRSKRVVSENQERPLRMSGSLAQAPTQVSYGIVNINDLKLRSAAVMVVDQKTGEALYAKNPDVATPIASITKLMTSMVVLDAGLALAEEITINNEDLDRLKNTSSRLALGTTLTREELLHLALIASENRAAAALSRSYPGGREAFVEAMNRKAAALGMTHTRFVDGTGLDSSNSSTAADLVKLVEAAAGYPMLRQITSTGQYGVTMPSRQVVRVRENGKVRRVAREVTRQVAFHNTNALTRSPSWDIGLSKTGYINEAGHCLVMQANIADRPVIMVLLDSWGKLSRIGDAARVRKWLESQHTAGRLAQLQRDSSV